MKTAVILSLSLVSLLSGCVTEQHYHPQETTYVPVPVRPPSQPVKYAQPRKASPGVRSSSAGDFEAVERPSSYSR